MEEPKKAVVLLYQTPHNIIEEKTGKDGEKRKAVEFEEIELTEEVLEKFPEFKTAKTELGSMVRVPKTMNPENIVLTKGFIMEIETIFQSDPDDVIAEAEFTIEFNEATEKLSVGDDHQKILNDHIRWMIGQGWDLVGFYGTVYAFKK